MNKYDDFFEKMSVFKAKQDAQKRRGLNDYNLLTTVLKPTDEVRLHSKVISSLLDPKGDHYQKSLFLEAFVDMLGVDGFELDFENAVVEREKNNIDVYISDGKRHIIIENKVEAGDQDRQIERYVDSVKKKSKGLNSSGILVVYLTLDRDKPSEKSLGRLTVDGGFLRKDNEKICFFKPIHYGVDILRWLDTSRKEVQNITNLNESIKQYEDVVKMIANKYESKVMSISDYVKKNPDVYKMMMEVSNELPLIRKNIMRDFFSNVSRRLSLDLGDVWEVEYSDGFEGQYCNPLRIFKKEWDGKKLYFLFEFISVGKMGNGYCFGVAKDRDEISLDDVRGKFKAEISLLELAVRKSNWWLFSDEKMGFHGGSDFSEYVFLNKTSEDNFINRVLEVIDVFERDTGLLTKINKYLNS